MSSDKLVIFIILGVVALGAIAFGVWWFFLRNKSSKSGAGKVEDVFKNADENLKGPVKEKLGLNDDQFKLFIAGAQTISSLTSDNFKAIFKLKDEGDDKKKTKESISEFEKERKLVSDFLKIKGKDEKKVKDELDKSDSLKWVGKFVKDESENVENVSKKGEDPFKDIISSVQKTNEKEKDTFTKKISDKKEYNIVEAVVCHVPELFKKCIKA